MRYTATLTLTLTLFITLSESLSSQTIRQVPGQYSTIAAAYAAAAANDVIELAPGTYAEDVSLSWPKNVRIRGMGAGPEDVIINGHVDIWSPYLTGANCYSPFALESLTIANTNSATGGITLADSTVDILGCVIRDNSGPGGAAIDGFWCCLQIRDSLIIGNTCTGPGTFAAQDAGGIAVQDTFMTLENTIVRDNVGITVSAINGESSSDVTLDRSVVRGNTGGDTVVRGLGIVLMSATVVDNVLDQGSSLPALDSQYVFGDNSIVWNNHPASGTAAQVPGTATMQYCNIQGGIAGTGNIDADPMLYAATGYHLLPGSPCIDAGSTALLLLPGLTDIDGTPITQGVERDMGADETQVAARPGTGEDLRILTYAPQSSGPGDGDKSVASGSVLTMSIESPNGGFAFDTLYVAVESFTTGAPGPAAWPGFPELYVHPTTASFLPGLGPLTGAVLHPAGLHLAYVLPPQLAGSTIRLQAATASSFAANGLFAATDAHDLVIQ